MSALCHNGHYGAHASKQREQDRRDDLHENTLSVLGGAPHCARSFIERGAKSPSKLPGIIICPKVKEEEAWLLVQHVAVNGRYLHAICPKRANDRVHLVAGQDKVTCNSRFTAAVGWKLIPVASPMGPAGAIGIPLSLTGSRRGTPN